LEHKNFKNIRFLILTTIVILWGSHASVVVFLSENLSTSCILFYTYLISTISLFIFNLTTGRLLNIFKNIKKEKLPFMTLLGIYGIFGYEYLFIEALNRASPVEVNILNYLWPVMIVVFSVIILKQELKLNIVIGCLVAYFGAIIVIVMSSSTGLNFSMKNILGYILGIIVAIIWGSFSVMLKKENYEPFFSTLYFNFLTFLITGVFLLLDSSFVIPKPKEFLVLVYNGVGTTAMPFVLWTIAMTKYDVQKVASFTYLTPFISTSFLAIFLGKNITIYALIGLIAIVSGTIISELRNDDVKYFV
jgi:drug/metabolite transporter (DMT)-like permease